jgi:hypothetical protein
MGKFLHEIVYAYQSGEISAAEYMQQLKDNGYWTYTAPKTQLASEDK